GPVLPRDEGLDLSFALDDEAHGDRLDPSRGKAGAHLAPEERAERVPHEPVDDAAGLLRVDESAVDVARVREGVADRAGGDLSERHAAGLLRWVVGRRGR